jgi:uncharacterized SAM-binding protein YcdF (DUF218 family)
MRRWWHVGLQKLYDALALRDQTRQVDAIFVMAGRMERKTYGFDLFRAGFAPRLILSVGRFEVSKMRRLGLPAYEALASLRDKTPPGDRHFFVDLHSSGVEIHRVKLATWNTYGEALALQELIGNTQGRRVMIVSTDIHLRRVALTFSKVLRGLRAQFLYCPVPNGLSSLKADRWWTRSDARAYVLQEAIKLAGYRIILSMPMSAARYLMRLTHSFFPRLGILLATGLGRNRLRGNDGNQKRGR